MRVDAKSLVRKLTPTATRLLEAAVGRAAQGGYYEIAVEHLLAAMLEPDDGDAARILANWNADRKRLHARIEADLQRMRQGNPGRPVISESVFNWLEDAWLLASVELGAVKLRSGHLLLQLAARLDRYLGRGYPELEALSLAELRRDLLEVLAPSPESAEAALELGSLPGGAAAPASGLGEALARFATNFTERAREGKIDPIFGRHREIRQLVDILARRRKNNPIIVGEPGVGKTALVEGLALAIARGEVPEALRSVELLGLDLGLLQAGASVRGEFENRLKSVIAEVKASPKPIVLFIDEAHTLIGAGGAAGGGDAANLLKPALARGELRTVAATTWSEYKRYFEKDAALERRFQPVKVDEPSEDDAVLMLRGVKGIYEQAHGVTIRDEAVVAAVKLSRRGSRSPCRPSRSRWRRSRPSWRAPSGSATRSAATTRTGTRSRLERWSAPRRGSRRRGIAPLPSRPASVRSGQPWSSSRRSAPRGRERRIAPRWTPPRRSSPPPGAMGRSSTPRSTPTRSRG